MGLTTYEVIVVNTKYNTRIAHRYCYGIQELRDYVGHPLHYSKNAKGYITRVGDKEYLAMKCGTTC
jgi:hypothetical protein